MPFFVILFFITIFCTAAQASITDKTCTLDHATYTPHVEEKNEEYNAKLTFSSHKKAVPKEATFFINFDILDQNSNNKISSFRLGYACSVGMNVCRANSIYGQYDTTSFQKTKSDLELEILGLNQDFSKVELNLDKPAPYAIILPYSSSAFYYLHTEEVDKYTKFFTKDKFFPVFWSYETWILTSCNDHNGDKK